LVIVLALTGTCLLWVTPTDARWRSGNVNPGTLHIPPMSPQDPTLRACTDGVSFEFADVPSQGEVHPHPRPTGSPNSLTYRFVTESAGPNPPAGTVIVDQPLVVPYGQIDVLATSTPFALNHRDYSGTFTIPWSLSPGTSVVLRMFRPDGTEMHFLVDDGFEIQNCVLPTQPPGCGKVITRNTTLHSDLLGCLSGVVIGADDITLDLNGHTIDGIGGGKGVDNSSGHEEVTIKNGTIKEFETGVELIGAQDNHLHNLRITGTDDAIALFSSDDNRVEKNAASGNNYSGIVLANSDGNRVERNTATTNDDGIELVVGSDSNRVTRNDVSSNHKGIVINVSDRNQVEKNTAVSNDFTGIEVNGSGNQLERNVAAGTDAGISLFGSESRSNRFTGNTAFGRLGIEVLDSGNSVFIRNIASGVRLAGSDGNRLEGNSSSGSETGLTLEAGSDSNRLLRNDASGNTTGISIDNSSGNILERNSATGNLGDGIAVALTADGTVLVGSTTTSNGDDGIDVDNTSASTILTRNTANKNFDLGIEAETGVTDGGRNQAKRNGNAAQCTGVACS
jgi:parallel beta-helix repeat protein